MPGVFVSYCNVFLPSNIRTPQMRLHRFTIHEPECHLRLTLSAIDVPHCRDIGRIPRAHFHRIKHRIQVTYDGDAIVPILFQSSEKAFIPPSLRFVTVSVATPRDVGASGPVHLLSDNVGIRRVVRTHHNTGANLVQTISVYLNEENPLRLTHQLSIYTQIFHLHTSISSTLIHTSPCPLKRPPRMAEREAAKAILGDQVHARSRAAFAPHS